MVQSATQAAIDAVSRFTADPVKQEALFRWMEEAPIGDEYGYLSAEDWACGEQFEVWLSSQGLAAFEDLPIEEALRRIRAATGG
jgi:hypothetical protein